MNNFLNKNKKIPLFFVFVYLPCMLVYFTFYRFPLFLLGYWFCHSCKEKFTFVEERYEVHHIWTESGGLFYNNVCKECYHNNEYNTKDKA